MPFTFSHVVAILPLTTGRRSRFFDAAGLTVGAMVPDLPYFVPPYAGARWTHAWSGPVTVDLVLGLAVLAVWRAAVPGLVELAPGWLRSRISPSVARAGRWARAAWSVALGAATHVGWDSFSHPHRWGTDHVAWLSQPHGPLAGYKWVQYGSGVAGLLVLAVWFACWVGRRAPQALPAEDGSAARRRRWVCTGVVLALVAAVVLAWVHGASTSGRWLDERTAVQVARTAISVGLLVLAAVATWSHAWRRIRDSNS